MGLRRRRKELSRGRRRRQDTDVSRGAALTYGSRRPGREGSGGDETPAPQSLGRFLLQRFGLILLLAAVVFSAVNALSLSSDARIVLLKDDRSSPFLHDQKVYQQTASRLLASSVWNRNKLTVDTGAVARGMTDRFPELSEVSVTLPLLSQRPTVYVQTAREALILVADNGSFVIDTTGKALLNADNLPASRHDLPKVRDRSGMQVSINRQAISSADVSFIRTVKAQLAARRVSISAMDLPAGKNELDVRISGKPYLVKFNLESGTARQQAGTFLATKAELERRHTTPSRYIDVRVDGRAYYK